MTFLTAAQCLGYVIAFFFYVFAEANPEVSLDGKAERVLSAFERTVMRRVAVGLMLAIAASSLLSRSLL